MGSAIPGPRRMISVILCGTRRKNYYVGVGWWLGGQVEVGASPRGRPHSAPPRALLRTWVWRPVGRGDSWQTRSARGILLVSLKCRSFRHRRPA